MTTRDDQAGGQDDASTLLEGLSSEDLAYVRVYRMRGGKRAYLDRAYLSDGPDLAEVIRERWGGGDYYLQATDAGGIIRSTTTLTVDGPPRPLPPPPSSSAYQEHKVNDPEPAEDVGEMVAALRGIVSELRAPPPQAQAADPMVMAMSIVNAVTAATKPLQDAVLELMRRPAAEPVRGLDTSDLVKVFTDGLRAAASLDRKTGDAGPSHWDRLIDQVAIPMVRAAQQAPPPPPPPAPTRSSWTSSPAPAAPSTSAAMWQLVADNLEGLIRLCDAGKSAQLYAQVLVEDLPDDALDEIVAQVSKGEPFYAEFFARFPAAAEREAWFRALIGQMWAEGMALSMDDEATA